jgi:hypothetical protein
MTASDPTGRITDDELAAQQGETLPDRELMTLLTPTSGAAALPGLGGLADGSAPSASSPADAGTGAAGGAAGTAQHVSIPEAGPTYSPSTSSTATS